MLVSSRALTFLPFLLLLSSTTASAYEPVEYLRATNQGFIDDYEGRRVEVLVAFGGPVTNPVVGIPPGYQEEVLVAFGAPLTDVHGLKPFAGGQTFGFVEKGASEWCFNTPVGTTVVIRGTLRATRPVTGSGYDIAPLAFFEVEEMLSPEIAREEQARAEASEATRREQARDEQDRATREGAASNPLRGLDSADAVRRARLLADTAAQLDAAGIDDPAVRRRMIDSALEAEDLPPLQDGEDTP